MIAATRKSTVYLCLIRPALACLLRRLAKWKFSWKKFRFPAASGYGAAVRTINRTNAIGQTTEDMPSMSLWLVSAFVGFVPFLSYWPAPKFNDTTKKSVFFGEKWPINGKFQNFATKGFMWTLIHVFLPSFVKSVKRSDQTGVWYSSQKRLVFCPFLCGFWSDLAKGFTRSLFPHSPSLCQILSKSVQFSRRYIQKCLPVPDSLQYRRENL